MCGWAGPTRLVLNKFKLAFLQRIKTFFLWLYRFADADADGWVDHAGVSRVKI